ncbi:MAG: hypothetical protein BRD49_04505 [Bacteroidetes bacterium SW_10_40_5]|nr:MAG: hypothetical protein BRD49_04505 [Bacteroidetes bacterium SW_10_40_5]
MPEKNELEALVYLLDDSDEEVVKQVTDQLLSYGKSIIPVLEDLSLEKPDDYPQSKIDDVIQEIQFCEISDQFLNWTQSGAGDLLQGAYLVAKYRYPGLEREEIEDRINKIKLDVWLELNNHLTPLEKVKKFNYIFYNYYKFQGDVDDYHAPENSLINKVVEKKKGNPISLAILYSVIAQRLGIPVFGVNLPQHFILAYQDDRQFPKDNSLQGFNYLTPEQAGETLFYINAFNRGTVFNKWNIDQFLKQLNIDKHVMYYEPCSNVDTILRVLRNLAFSFESTEEDKKVNDLNRLHELLEPYSEGYS